MDSVAPFLEELTNDEIENIIAMNEEEIEASQEIIKAANKLLEQRKKENKTVA